jgi:hypothetical protein
MKFIGVRDATPTKQEAFRPLPGTLRARVARSTRASAALPPPPHSRCPKPMLALGRLCIGAGC